MRSFSSSTVLDAAARAAAALACLVTSDRRPRLAAPEPSAEAGGADVLAAVSMTARAGGSGPVLLAAGGDAGTSAAAAAGACAGACAGGRRGVEVEVRAGVEGVAPPSAGTSAPFAGVEATAVVASEDKVPVVETSNPAAAISLRACARRKATASRVSRISALLKKATVVRSEVARANADNASVLAFSIRDAWMSFDLSRLAALEPRRWDW